MFIVNLQMHSGISQDSQPILRKITIKCSAMQAK